MNPFIIYPAIDLRSGRVVRLSQGDPARQTVYGDDPAATARNWLKAGASWLHVINLDGAFGEQDGENRKALAAILEQTTAAHARVQFGGGLRSLAQVEMALDLGVSRVVLGTAAIQAPELVTAVLQRFGPDSLAIALDVGGDQVKTHGWLQESGVTPLALARALAARGVRTVVYTNIARDGVGGGTDIPAALRVASLGLQVIASGGVHTLEDVRAVRQAGLDGVIIGRALYEGRVDLSEALEC